MVTYYLNPDGSFPIQNGKAVLVTPTEVEDCCCEESAPCECPYEYGLFAAAEWDAESNGHTEYYVTLAWEPDHVFENFGEDEMTEGSVGSLATGEWGYDAGNTRLYVRMSDDAAPADFEVYAMTGPLKLQLSGYSDGDIPAGDCGDCQDDTVGVWTGDFGRDGDCGWSTGRDLHVTLGPARTVDGKLIDMGAYIGLQVGYWEMVIECLDSGWMTDTIWLGYKTTGDTPVGTYTRDSGCAATPSTLEVVVAS